MASKSITLHRGDCLAVLPTLRANSVDSVVIDPPYGLEFMGKEWDAPWKYRMQPYGMKDTKGRAAGPVFGSTRNPMCKACHKHKRGSRNHVACSCAEPQFDDIDHRLRDMAAFQGWCEGWARQLFRVLKPGGHIVAFGGSRTYHRLACAIEDAGFEIRDQIMWIYGQGFPKSRNVGKAIDAEAGAKRKVVKRIRVKGGGTEHVNRTNAAVHQFRPGEYQKGENVLDLTLPATAEAAQWEGWGTAVKPAHEPIVLARKPLSGTVAQNVRRWGTGALNIDGCRVQTAERDDYGRSNANASGTINAHNGFEGKSFKASERKGNDYASTLGRWPANVIHDGSEELVGAFPQSDGASGPVRGTEESETGQNGIYGRFARVASGPIRGDSGSAARFFYSAKASKKERRGSKHPTVKPLALMRYLVRLVTPPGGVVLDCFAGSGTTGEAARAEGMKAILIEREREYHADIRRRTAA